MIKEDSIALKRRIAIEKNCGVSVYIDCCNISKEYRNRIEEAADGFLDLVNVILNGK